ncbi:hypothetical protein Golomagni_07403, partial [Golovinomyces magnicellulatus]
MAGGHKPIRLPPLQTLRVKDPKRAPENPCIAIMTSVLACWASAGYNAAGCTAIENQLRKCMDGPPLPPAPANTINYHLGRMQKHVISRGKQYTSERGDEQSNEGADGRERDGRNGVLVAIGGRRMLSDKGIEWLHLWRWDTKSGSVFILYYTNDKFYT